MSEISKTIRTHIGRVVSNKMSKTINVLIERRVPHPKYKKIIKYRKKLMAHDENNTCQIGDLVMIQESKRISKNKSWLLVNILEKAADKTEVTL